MLRALIVKHLEQIKEQPFIRLNPRNQKEVPESGPHQCPLCPARLEMKSCGTVAEAHRTRIKFRSPIKASKKFAGTYPEGCLVADPHFAAYGCTRYLDVTDDARSRVPCDSKLLNETIKQRQVVEHYFARLGDREAKQTTHYALKSVRNQMALAHIVLSLVASPPSC